MTKTWVSADLHLGHRNILNFEHEGARLRPFDDIDHMHREMIARWNSIVSPKDRVYILGDVAMNKRGLELISEFNGRRVLVKGNHDREKPGAYARLFDDVRGAVCKGRFVMTHIPIHPMSIERWELNIHGHLHAKSVDDPRYVCVSVERNDFYPVDLQHILDGKFR